MDDGHVVLSMYVVLGLRLLAFSVLSFEFEQPSSYSFDFARDCVSHGVLCYSAGFAEADGNRGSNVANFAAADGLRGTPIRRAIDDRAFDPSLVFTSVSGTFAISIVFAVEYRIAAGPGILSIYL